MLKDAADIEVDKKEATAFVEAVEQVAEQELKNEKQALASKDDVQTLRKDIRLLELKDEQSKGDTCKAMFWTSIVQLIAIPGGVLAVVKLIK